MSLLYILRCFSYRHHGDLCEDIVLTEQQQFHTFFSIESKPPLSGFYYSSIRSGGIKYALVDEEHSVF